MVFEFIPYEVASKRSGLLPKENITQSLPSNNTQKTLVKIYPNPGAGELFFSETESFTDLLVSDVNGKIVFNGKPENGKLDLKELENGLYLIQLNNLDNQQIFFKWVIAK